MSHSANGIENIEKWRSKSRMSREGKVWKRKNDLVMQMREKRKRDKEVQMWWREGAWRKGKDYGIAGQEIQI